FAGVGVAGMTSRGGQDAFVTKISSAGDLIFARQAGGAGDDEATDVAIGAGSDVWTAGWFSGVGAFDPTSAVANLGSAGAVDAFLTRWRQPAITGAPAANQPVPLAGTVAPLVPVTLSVPGAGTLTLSVTVVNGALTGDFTAASAAGWTRAVVGASFVYTRTFAGLGSVASAQASMQALAFRPKAGAVAGQKTFFRLTVNDGLGAAAALFEVSAVTA
ncbi:MAG: hypothetical protein ACRC33_22440, partial [Gemmataceae bacterium]